MAFKLARSSSAKTSRFATNDRRSGVDRGAGAIREDNFAAVVEFAWDRRRNVRSVVVGRVLANLEPSPAQ